MHLEAVTICINYGDFLEVTARYNRGLFERWIIVTTEEDERTREVCRRFGLETLLTEDDKRDGDFSKGRLIDRALHILSRSAWRLHMDADIIQPSNFRALLDAAHLDPTCIYGWDRIMCRTPAQWKAVLDSGFLEHQLDYHCRIHWPKGVCLGDRWAHPKYGWCPIGWSQLWHGRSDEWHGIRTKHYQHNHGDACRTDVQFAMQWDRRKRVFIPEVIAVHLESEPAKLGANWKGRTTKPFVEEKD